MMSAPAWGAGSSSQQCPYVVCGAVYWTAPSVCISSWERIAGPSQYGAKTPYPSRQPNICPYVPPRFDGFDDNGESVTGSSAMPPLQESSSRNAMYFAVDLTTPFATS